MNDFNLPCEWARELCRHLHDPRSDLREAAERFIGNAMAQARRNERERIASTFELLGMTQKAELVRRDFGPPPEAIEQSVIA